jgi:hypothetical protein
MDTKLKLEQQENIIAVENYKVKNAVVAMEIADLLTDRTA